jgi:hypothetical protein
MRCGMNKQQRRLQIAHKCRPTVTRLSAGRLKESIIQIGCVPLFPAAQVIVTGFGQTSTTIVTGIAYSGPIFRFGR